MEREITGFKPTQIEKNKFLAKTYLWMALALLISAAAAFFAANSETLMYMLWGINLSAGTKGRPIGFIVLAVAEVALVWILSLRIRKMHVVTCVIFYLLYSIINGLTLSSIFWVFSLNSIAYTFAGTCLLFLIMAIFGANTKSNLAGFGHYLLMGLIGLIIISGINLLMQFITKIELGWVNWIISLATVLIFTGLTAVDSQKILRTAEIAKDNNDFKKLAIFGALQLYIDFINIFLALLRLFGRRSS